MNFKQPFVESLVYKKVMGAFRMLELQPTSLSLVSSFSF